MKNKKGQRTSETSSLKDAFDSLLKTYKLEDKYKETELLTSWEKMMGKLIANKTKDIYISNKKLYVTLSSAPLKHEMNMSKSKIMDIINRELGEGIVNEIIIK